MNPREHADTAISLESRRVRKARLTRQAMLDAGLAAFQRQPPALVSVLDITEAADVAKGVFYLHFASKDQFLLSLWEHVQDVFLAVLHQRLSEAKVSARAGVRQRRLKRLSAAIAAYAHHAADHPQHVCFTLRMSAFIGGEIGLPGELAARRTLYLERLTAIVEGMPHGSPIHPSAITVVRAMDAQCWGIIWQTLQLAEPFPSEDVLLRQVVPSIERLLDCIPSGD